MLCYSCAEQGVHQTAIALCRSCYAGLCMDHLRETAAQLASDPTSDRMSPHHCQHDTWSATERPVDASAHPHAASPA
jgi:hypothetical protein